MKEDVLRVARRCRQHRVVRRCPDNVDMMWPVLRGTELKKDIVEVRGKDGVNETVVNEPKETVIPCARRNAWLDYAKEEVFPRLAGLEQVLYYDRVVIRRHRILSVPLVPVQPAKPIASHHAWVILMKAVGFAIRPLGGSFDELIACGNS